MHTSDGRRLLVGWMVPDGEEMLQPTLASGWIHQMTCASWNLSTASTSIRCAS